MASITAEGTVSGGGLRASLMRNRRWALIASYTSLIVFVIFFLFPPYYMLITSLKTNREIAELATSPEFDQIEVQRLKKRKLQLKDEIARLENAIIPDIIA